MSAFENPADLFLASVPNHDDVVAFRFPFEIEQKAMEDGSTPSTVTETDDGDLIIEGWAANFEGIDREGENFTDGAFEKGIKSFLDGQAALCFHHKMDHGIGSVLDLKEVEGKGLWMKARVDHQPESSPLRYIYNAVKKGSYRGLSVGGFFSRKIVNGVKKIAGVDFTEVSITPVAVHPGTKFSVVAGKALEDLKARDAVLADPEIGKSDDESIQWMLHELETVFDGLNSGSPLPQAKAASDPLNDADKSFLKEMIPHHQHALEMVHALGTKGSSSAVSALASKIASTQEKEIVTMEKLLGSGFVAPPHPSAHSH